MKKTRFTEKQMVTILREADQRPRSGGGQKERRQRPDALRLAETLRHVGARRCEAAAAARAGERPAEKDGGRSRSGDRRAQGDHPKKMVGARVRRPQVAYARARGLSGRRACALLSVARSTLGYQSRLGRPGCPGAGRDASSGGAVSAVRLSPDSDFPKTRRAHDEHGPDPSPLAPGGVAGASAAAAAPGRPEPAPPGARHCGQSRLGVGLRVRHLREWADAQVPHRRRRMDPRVTRDRRGRRHSVRARYRGAHAARERPLSPTLPPVRQRPRVCRGCDSPVAAPGADRNRAHRAGEAVAECDRRIVQREVPRRVSEPAVVSEPRGREGGDRAMATALQRHATALEPWLSDASRVQSAAPCWLG